VDTSLLWTVTAFTLGHSLTLALASLGLVKVPQAPIEAAIALSIYFLAVELTRRRAGTRTFTQRAPWLVACSFGLLHGLGFRRCAERGWPPLGRDPAGSVLLQRRHRAWPARLHRRGPPAHRRAPADPS
jgi:hypothetical protein